MAVLIMMMLSASVPQAAATPPTTYRAYEGPFSPVTPTQPAVTPMPTALPTPTPTSTPKPTPKPTKKPASKTRGWTSAARGRATWYFNGSGFYAAAGPALRVGNWRGRQLKVCYNGRCIRLRLTDWCQCYKGTANERVIDLSRDAFRALAPLSRGVIKVEVYR